MNKVNTIAVNPDRLFTKTEYCKMMGISRPTLDKYIKENQVATIKVKGAVLIRQ